MKFKKEQQIVCIKRDAWVGRFNKLVMCGPLFNEVVTVSGYSSEGYVTLYEHPNGGFGFNETRFAPLADITEITALLEEPITVTVER